MGSSRIVARAFGVPGAKLEKVPSPGNGFVLPPRRVLSFMGPVISHRQSRQSRQSADSADPHLLLLKVPLGIRAVSRRPGGGT